MENAPQQQQQQQQGDAAANAPGEGEHASVSWWKRFSPKRSTDANRPRRLLSSLSLLSLFAGRSLRVFFCFAALAVDVISATVSASQSEQKRN